MSTQPEYPTGPENDPDYGEEEQGEPEPQECRLLPALPGMVQGIVAVDTTEAGRTVYTLQCQGCGDTEQPWPLVLMTFKFCPVQDKDRGRDRLCPGCRTASLLGQGFSEREAHSIVTEGYIR